MVSVKEMKLWLFGQIMEAFVISVYEVCKCDRAENNINNS